MKSTILSGFLRACLVALASIALAPLAQAVEVSFERDPSLPTVNINVAIKAGSVDDPEGQAGLTNFLGEMLLRGTELRSKEQLDLEIDQIGARLEVETRAEALILRGAVLSSQLDKFLAILGEIVTRPSFPEAEIRKLKAKITSEILEELGRDQSLASRRFESFLFRGHPYGKPVLGKVKDVERISRESLLAHYNRLVRDKRLLIVGSGDADPQGQIKTWAESIASIRAGGASAPKLARPEDPTSRRVLIIDKPERTQTQIFGGQVGLRMTDQDFFPLYVANHVFGGGSFSARLMTEIRVKRGWSYGAYSTFRHGTQPRYWRFYLFPAAKDTPAALRTSLQMVEELRNKGISEGELDFARASLINSAGFMFNTPKKRVENKLLERTLDLPEGFMKNYAENISRVTLAEINSALKRFLHPDRLSITVLGTAKDLRKSVADAAGVSEKVVHLQSYQAE